ncbi:MAG: hypothetical protein ACREQM_05095 [Candidatus Dormibacteraceae bacterium]
MDDVGQVLTLIDDAGRPRRFRAHDALDQDGATYYLVEALDDPEQVLVLREDAGTLEAVTGEERIRILDAFESDS